MIPLRPLSFGEMFSAVFDTLRRGFKALYLPLLTVAGIGAVPVVLVSLMLVGNLRDALDRLPADEADVTAGQLWDVMSPVLLLGLVLGLVLLAQFMIAAPLSAVVLRAATLGRPITVGQAWKEMRPRLWPAVLSQAMVYLPMTVFYIAAIGVPFALGVWLDNPALLLLDFLMIPVVLVVFCYVTVRLTLQVPVLVLEETTPVGGIRRAWRLNQGNWWRSLLLTVVVAIAGRIAANIVMAPLGIVLGGMMPTVVINDSDLQQPVTLPGGGALTALVLVASLLTLLFSTVTAPLGALANGVMYIDRRIRNERLDIALAEAAGIRLADPAAPAAQPASSAQPAAPAQPAPAAPGQPPAQPPVPPAQRVPEEAVATPVDAPPEQPAPFTKDDSATS
ncbi:hypothetical protein AMK19_30240 [Kitasatospora sp. CB01950]|nr:hypothetical protein AMK19_30240 [Kitasatospora sp. CB01950]